MHHGPLNGADHIDRLLPERQLPKDRTADDLHRQTDFYKIS